jgi:hypothetical protein
MDEVVDEAALVEGCATLVAVVRVGANRNTSIKSHTRRGWERTGIVINEDSEVLIRKLREPTGGASKVVRSAATQADNLIREYLPHMHLDPNDEMALFAPEVPDWWLEGRVRAVAEGWSWCHREARITRQSNGSLEVVFEADRFSICLKQLRRGFDVWECSLLQQAGGLEEFLDYINVWQGLGWQWYAVLSLDAFKR